MEIDHKNGSRTFIDATFDDIEWNYGTPQETQIKMQKELCKSCYYRDTISNKLKDLEEEKRNMILEITKREEIMLDKEKEIAKLEEEHKELVETNYDLAIKKTKLEEENKKLKKLNVCVGCDNNPDYKSRIDEAIKYIKDNVAVYSFGNKSEDYAHWEFDDSNIQDLLQILNTEEK